MKMVGCGSTLARNLVSCFFLRPENKSNYAGHEKVEAKVNKKNHTRSLKGSLGIYRYAYDELFAIETREKITPHHS